VHWGEKKCPREREGPGVAEGGEILVQESFSIACYFEVGEPSPVGVKN
jgi:hypothetical protein